MTELDQWEELRKCRDFVNKGIFTTGQTTLETSGEDAKIHSKRVEKMLNYTRNEWGRCQTTLETSQKELITK